MAVGAEVAEKERLVRIDYLAPVVPIRRQVPPDSETAVHDVTAELRNRVVETTWGELRERPQVRYVCSCGFTTSWHRRELQAFRKMKTHALDGQLAMRIAP